MPDYLHTAEQPVAPNLMDYGVDLGRRFRALKLWMVMRTFGAEVWPSGSASTSAWPRCSDPGSRPIPAFEVVAPQPLSVVCFRLRDEARPAEEEDARNQALIDAVNATGEVFLSHTKLHGRLVLRLAIGSLRTEERPYAGRGNYCRHARVNSAGAGPRGGPGPGDRGRRPRRLNE